MIDLCEGPGTALFTGGGAWLMPPGLAAATGHPRPSLLLRDPCRILAAWTSDQVREVLEGVAEAQARGDYVAGYLAYEAGGAFGLPVHEVRCGTRRPAADAALPCATDIEPTDVPLAWMAVYPAAHARTLVPEAASFDGTTPEATGAPTLNVTYEEYVRAISAVREYIAAGDTYQVNYTVRARFRLNERPLRYFLARSAAHPVPYGAYLDLGERQILSHSPELFLCRRGWTLESRPMKGTRPRRTRKIDDVALAYELIGSQKDRAEDLMIVDMVRNDIGRVCKPGSVQVPSLFTVEPYGTVWQMSSTVQGRLPSQIALSDIMAAAFPGASITGAPKHHTMEIIRELEKEPRGIYTGCLGLFLPGGDFTCNLCIRTIVHHEGRCLLGVGSGVVWDSDAKEEYEETLTKASFAFSPRAAGGGPAERPTASPTSRPEEPHLALLETILLEAQPREVRDAKNETPLETGPTRSSCLERYRHLEDHLARMRASARALSHPFPEQDLRMALATLATEHVSSVVVRLTVDPDGTVKTLVRPRPPDPLGPVTLAVSPFRTDPDDLLLRHKTTVRPLYDREYQRVQQSGYFDALFLNRLDQVTEGAITNVAARFGDRWVTPPLEDGLLPGIWRAHFIRTHACTEESLTIDDLAAADEVVIGNSVRGTVRVAALVLDALEGLLD